MNFDFVKIADLEKHEKGSNIGKLVYIHILVFYLLMLFLFLLRCDWYR